MSRVRRAVWWAGAPVRMLLIGLIHLYRFTLSGSLGGQCRFSPTCSHYAEDAIREHGPMRGTVMAAWRIARDEVQRLPGYGGQAGAEPPAPTSVVNKRQIDSL